MSDDKETWFNYEDCIHLEPVDKARSTDGSSTYTIYRCAKGHMRCQESIFSEKCPDFETECDVDCIHYYCDYITNYDEDGCSFDVDMSRCKLGRMEIENGDLCKYYESKL